jgi:hypothetical protein
MGTGSGDVMHYSERLLYPSDATSGFVSPPVSFAKLTLSFVVSLTTRPSFTPLTYLLPLTVLAVSLPLPKIRIRIA